MKHPNWTPSEKAWLHSFDSGIGACTFGMSTFTADGKRLVGGGGYQSDGVLSMLKTALAKFRPDAGSVTLDEDKDRASLPRMPEGGLSFYVNWKLRNPLATKDKPATFGQLGTDRLWVRRDEAEALAAGSFPESLARRMMRDHVGYLMGKEISGFNLAIDQGKIEGSFTVKDAAHPATYRGIVEAKNGKVTRFDLVIKGWGKGKDHDHGFSVCLCDVPSTELVPLALQFELGDPSQGLAQVIPSQWQENWYLK